MARLVVLSEGFTGLSYEIKAEKTTVGRIEDNSWQIADASVSSHHAEILLKGDGIWIKDLDSTNGTFIDGEPVTEALLKPGQILRLGEIDMRLEVATAADKKAAASTQTRVIPQGVKMSDLERGRPKLAPETSAMFKKKSDKGTKVFIAVAIGILVIIVVLLVVILMRLKS
jgi:pSer/pThr/pTyr-binding forkhead associated (FHA) protein